MPVKVIPVVGGALGTAPEKLKQQLSDGKNSGIAGNYHRIFCKDPPKFLEV